MRKVLPLLFIMAIAMSSCVSKGKFVLVGKQKKEAEEQLIAERAKLKACEDEKNDFKSDLASAKATIASLESTNALLQSQLQSANDEKGLLLQNIGNLTTMSAKDAENLERSLESLREKDRKINSLRDAITRRDSVQFALITSLKGALGNLADSDIEVNVEKGVVFISISDKLLFESGSYNISSRATEVLGKVAKVVNDKPDMEFLVEGHTDDVPITKPGIKDNWDLSVLRATAIVRVLQNDFNVAPERMTAGGRSSYIPLAQNDSPENRAKNRRTRIVVLPKLDQFYEMIEDGMKEAEAAEGSSGSTGSTPEPPAPEEEPVPTTNPSEGGSSGESGPPIDD